MCKDRQRQWKRKYWGRGKVGKEEDILNVLVRFLKYEFNNKLFDGVTFLRVTPSVTWTQLYIYIYIYIWFRI